MSKIIWGKCKEREEQRDELETLGNTEQQCGQTGRVPGPGRQACQESGQALNSVSCLKVFRSDKAWQVAIGFGSQDVIGDLSKSCFRNSGEGCQIAVGEALWEVREWRHQGLSVCQSSWRRRDVRCHLEGEGSQGRFFKWEWWESAQ